MLELNTMASERRRIIDANLNRAGEGLHLLEDIARLMLNDADLSQQLKTMRHELIKGDGLLHQKLLQSRNSEGDVGIDIEVPGEEKDRELLDAADVEFLFIPEVNDMYPSGYQTFVEVTEVSKGLCGDFRPGHFRGIATIVAELFSIFSRQKMSLFCIL